MFYLELGTSLIVIIMRSRTCWVSDPQNITFNTQWIAHLNENTFLQEFDQSYLTLDFFQFNSRFTE